jgi:four helix bundle protein
MNNLIEIRSFNFAVNVVKLCRYLRDTKKEYVISQQLLKSGTSIGANISEALHGQSKADFIAKMNISLKEASETKYWFRLLIASDTITDDEGSGLLTECIEIQKILFSIVKTSKENENKK